MEAILSGDGMTTSPVNLFTSAHDLTGCFVQAVVILSRSMQGNAVITVRCHVEVVKTTSETRLLALKVKMIESEN
jgi:hypothetical protein